MAEPPGTASRPTGIRRGQIMTFAIALVIAASLLALQQSPRPNPLAPPSLLDILFYPLEIHGELRLATMNQDIHALHARRDGRRLWAVGNNGLIAFSDDGGSSWTLQNWTLPGESNQPARPSQDSLPLQPEELPASRPPAAAWINRLSPLQAAYAGEMPAANDAPTPPPKQPYLQNVEPNAAPVMEKVTPVQAQPYSQESPANALPLASSSRALPRKPHWRSIYFLDEKQGWIGGDLGVVLHTRDGGETWQASRLPVDVMILGVVFVRADLGWAVADSGEYFYSTDGGVSWSYGRTLSRNPLLQIQARANRVWISDGRGLYVASPGRDPWLNAQRSPFEDNRFFFIDDQRGWSVGNGGAIHISHSGGSQWEPQRSDTREDLRDVIFVDQLHGWAIGKRGSVLTTSDGGDTWAPQDSGTQSTLNSVTFIDQERGWIAGDSGVLLTTRDGGGNWFPLTRTASDVAADARYQRYPALWYWLVCMVALALILLAPRFQRKLRAQSTSVADILASDRPLRPGDPDPLQFGRIARGLSRFIRNPATEPPLTIAVTGEWGTGKSSLMSLLFHDLKRQGFTPVWFNAWHHQKGEQLLASLYATIREQAVPGLTKFHGGVPVGMLFRLRLLYRRSRRRWLLALLLLALLASTGSYLMSHDTALTALNLAQLFNTGEQEWIDKLVLALIGIFPPLAALYNGLRAFGIRPSSLITTTPEHGGSHTLDPGARQRFARQFSDVSESLELGRMVIFIDDLDRCSKENVLEILETINFLSVSGNCYIILGMAEEWVKTCVGLGFKDLAEAKLMPGDAHSPGHLQEFAEQYLEKLINIRVPVPTLTATDAGNLLVPPPSASARKLSPLRERLQQWRKTLLRRNQWLALIGVIVAGLVAGYFWQSDWIWIARAPAKPTAQDLAVWQDVRLEQVALAEGEPRLMLSIGANNETPRRRSGPDWELVLQGQPEAARDGIVLKNFSSSGEPVRLLLRQQTTTITEAPALQSSSRQNLTSAIAVNDAVIDQSRARETLLSRVLNWLTLSAVLLALGVLVLLQSLRHTHRVERDSPRFQNALKVWQPWIAARRLTPRNIKRYMNRVRYIAMRFREEPVPPATLWQRLRQKLPGADQPLQACAIDEAILVALSAIQMIDPDWVTDREKFARLTKGDVRSLYAEAFSADAASAEQQTPLLQAFEQSIRDHVRQFGDAVFSDPLQRQNFLDVMAQARQQA